MGFEGKLNKAFLLFLPILCCIIFQFDYFGFRNGPFWNSDLEGTTLQKNEEMPCLKPMLKTNYFPPIYCGQPKSGLRVPLLHRHFSKQSTLSTNTFLKILINTEL